MTPGPINTDNRVTVHAGGPRDVDELSALFLDSRATAMPWLAVLHDYNETRWWMANVVLTDLNVLVARRQDSRIVGFAVVAASWLEHLYVAPDVQGCGVGRALLDGIKARMPGPLRLHVFSRNVRARQFYQAAGFTLVEERDGSGNEENEPDCVYELTRRTD